MSEIKRQLPSKKLILISLPLLVLSCMATIVMLHHFEHSRITRETATQGHTPTELSLDSSSAALAATTQQHDKIQPSLLGQQTATGDNQASSSVSTAEQATSPSSTPASPEAASQVAPVAAPSSQPSPVASPTPTPVVEQPRPSTTQTTASSNKAAIDQAPKQQARTAANTCSISLLGLCVSLGL